MNIGSVNTMFPSYTQSCMVEGELPYFSAPVSPLLDTDRSVELYNGRGIHSCYGILVSLEEYFSGYMEGNTYANIGSEQLVLKQGFTKVRVSQSVKRDQQLAFINNKWVKATETTGFTNVVAMTPVSAGDVVEVQIFLD